MFPHIWAPTHVHEKVVVVLRWIIPRPRRATLRRRARAPRPDLRERVVEMTGPPPTADCRGGNPPPGRQCYQTAGRDPASQRWERLGSPGPGRHRTRHPTSMATDPDSNQRKEEPGYHGITLAARRFRCNTYILAYARGGAARTWPHRPQLLSPFDTSRPSCVNRYPSSRLPQAV